MVEPLGLGFSLALTLLVEVKDGKVEIIYDSQEVVGSLRGEMEEGRHLDMGSHGLQNSGIAIDLGNGTCRRCRQCSC